MLGLLIFSVTAPRLTAPKLQEQQHQATQLLCSVRTVEPEIPTTTLADFFLGAPNPRRTAPIVEIRPAVFGTDPRNGATTAPRDATIDINFTEPVTVDAGWYDITCVSSGNHNDATVRSFFGGDTYTITPNVEFHRRRAVHRHHLQRCGSRCGHG